MIRAARRLGSYVWNVALLAVATLTIAAMSPDAVAALLAGVLRTHGPVTLCFVGVLRSSPALRTRVAILLGASIADPPEGAGAVQ